MLIHHILVNSIMFQKWLIIVLFDKIFAILIYYIHCIYIGSFNTVKSKFPAQLSKINKSSFYLQNYKVKEEWHRISVHPRGKKALRYLTNKIATSHQVYAITFEKTS